MRILVTGHNGYIGTVLTPMLMKKGHQVVGIDANIFKRCTFIDEVPEVPSISKDIRDIEQRDVEGFGAVIHLASLSNDPLGGYRPKLCESINHWATVRLAVMAKAAGVKRFLFASSYHGYSAGGEGFLDEQAHLTPVAAYGLAKVRVERDLSRLADGGFSPVYLRTGLAYGLSPRIRFDTSVNNLAARACVTGRIILPNKGDQWRSFVHVEDIARAYVASIEAPRYRIHNEPFNVGLTAENYRMRDIAVAIQTIVPFCTIEGSTTGSSQSFSYRLDCNKVARKLPEFKPQWTIGKGINQLYRGFDGVRLTLADLESSRFGRVAHVKKLIAEKQLDKNLRWMKG